MEDGILNTMINRSKKNAEKHNIQKLTKLLDSIEEGESSTELVTLRLFEMLIALEIKLDSFSAKLNHLSDIARKITEIHTLHFPSNSFRNKEDILKDQYLAQILLEIPRKRKTQKRR